MRAGSECEPPHPCLRAWGLSKLFSSFHPACWSRGGGAQTGLHPCPASSLAIVGARAAPWQALPCKQHIAASERRKEKEKESQTCREARTTCQHEEQTGPWTKCGLSYRGEGVGIVIALCRHRNSTDHRHWPQVCSSTAEPAQGGHHGRALVGFLLELAGAWGIGRLLTALPHHQPTRLSLMLLLQAPWRRLLVWIPHPLSDQEWRLGVGSRGPQIGQLDGGEAAATSSPLLVTPVPKTPSPV